MHPFPALQSECLFSCNFAPGLSYPQPRQVTMVHHAARMRLESTACHGVATLSRRRMELSSPSPARLLWLVYPLRQQGARGRTRVLFTPKRGETCTASPHSNRSAFFSCNFAPGLSHPSSSALNAGHFSGNSSYRAERQPLRNQDGQRLRAFPSPGGQWWPPHPAHHHPRRP